ncbi:hypothetical protein [Thermoproteus sp. CP80]|uniref:hypothetical protein n=1 Tax=Thermoproteus sp. CP80 TaxID=1650659 RepID=UPI001EDCC1A8|nr:hypothetical protein [Thermoproteus sp. CP80]
MAERPSPDVKRRPGVENLLTGGLHSVARHVRLLGVATSLLALSVGLLYNIAITRKLPTGDLGLVTLLNASTAFSLLPNAILGFALPRIAARDGGLGIRAALGVANLFFIASAGLTAAYLAAVWGEMGPYGPLVAFAALAAEASAYVSSVASSVLMVKDRGRFVVSNLLQAGVKLAAVGAIYAARWSVSAVLWSSVAISAVPALYGLYYASRYYAPGSLRRYFKETVSASWVPLMGYAMNSFRSLDAALIGVLGALDQVGLWYVFFMLSKPYSFSSILSGITYGELLEGRRGGLYRDLLMVMSLSTIISLSYIFFEPYYINFLRPGQSQYLAPLFVPLAVWSAANVLGNLNYFLANAMQGIDRRDIQSGEIRARTYVGSLVMYAHLAELAFTVVYLASIVPFVELAKRLGSAYYAIDGVAAASLAANAAALAFRIAVVDRKSAGLMEWRPLLRDYAAPLAASSVSLWALSRAVRLPLGPSALLSLAEVVLAISITGAVYVGLSAALSRNFRRLLVLVLRNLTDIIGRIAGSSQTAGSTG